MCDLIDMYYSNFSLCFIFTRGVLASMSRHNCPENAELGKPFHLLPILV